MPIGSMRWRSTRAWRLPRLAIGSMHQIEASSIDAIDGCKGCVGGPALGPDSFRASFFGGAATAPTTQGARERALPDPRMNGTHHAMTDRTPSASRRPSGASRVFVAAAACALATASVAQTATPPGADKSATTRTLEAGAKALQRTSPLGPIDIHLVGFHPMKEHPQRQVLAPPLLRAGQRGFRAVRAVRR